MSIKRITGNSLYAVRKKHFAKQPLCVHCFDDGRITLAAELDHIIPLWAGGTNDPGNYQSLCIEHHAAKTLHEQGKAGMTRPVHSWVRKAKAVVGEDGWPTQVIVKNYNGADKSLSNR